jgi:hypothetical protein
MFQRRYLDCREQHEVREAFVRSSRPQSESALEIIMGISCFESYWARNGVYMKRV